MSDFDIFGDCADAPPPTQTTEALEYLSKRKQQQQQQPTSTQSPSTTPQQQQIIDKHKIVDLSDYGTLWTHPTSPHIKTLHSSIVVTDDPSMGGSRDVTTSEPLSPGTLILKEEALVRYPENLTTDDEGNKTLDFSIVREILGRTDSDEVVKVSENKC